jgi:hypothetical protein
MELYDHNIEKLEEIWASPVNRQNAQLVIVKAIGEATDLSVADAHAILEELDRILLKEAEDNTPKKDRAL